MEFMIHKITFSFKKQAQKLKEKNLFFVISYQEFISIMFNSTGLKYTVDVHSRVSLTTCIVLLHIKNRRGSGWGMG